MRNLSELEIETITNFLVRESLEIINEEIEYFCLTPYWADFGKHFISRVRKIDKEHGGEVLSGFSLSDLFKLIK